MSFSPYLGFAGNARTAMTHYAAIFGATDLQIMDFADAPDGHRPADAASRVMHSQFSAGPGAPLMAADMPVGMPVVGITGSVFHAAPSIDRARAIFDALAEGGHVHMPFAATFWSPGFGGLVDKFGTSWMITVAEGPPAA